MPAVLRWRWRRRPARPGPRGPAAPPPHLTSALLGAAGHRGGKRRGGSPPGRGGAPASALLRAVDPGKADAPRGRLPLSVRGRGSTPPAPVRSTDVACPRSGPAGRTRAGACSRRLGSGEQLGRHRTAPVHPRAGRDGGRWQVTAIVEEQIEGTDRSGVSLAASKAPVVLRSQMYCFRNRCEGKDSVALHSSWPPA